MAMTSPLHQLTVLQAGLQQLRIGTMTVTAFSRLAREQGELLVALPPKFELVLRQVLDRLESSALFSDESCSFSQKDLLDSLQQWLDHAQGQLDKGIAA